MSSSGHAVFVAVIVAALIMRFFSLQMMALTPKGTRTQQGLTIPSPPEDRAFQVHPKPLSLFLSVFCAHTNTRSYPQRVLVLPCSLLCLLMLVNVFIRGPVGISPHFLPRRFRCMFVMESFGALVHTAGSFLKAFPAVS